MGAQDMVIEAEVNGVEGHTEKTNVTRAMTDNVDEVVHVAAPKKSGKRSSKAKKSVVEVQAKAVAYQVSGLAEADLANGSAVYDSPTSGQIRMYLSEGTIVESNGKSQTVDGYAMLPIKPSGAVQLDFLKLRSEAGTEA